MSTSTATNGPSERTSHAVVVSDDPIQLEALSGLLSREGLVVRAFESAAHALADMIDKASPDLIVTDLWMPGIDGRRFCRLLRSTEYEAFNHVPIMVVSALFAGSDSTGVTADLAADEFLAAPVDGREFTERARQLLRGERSQRVSSILIVEGDAVLVGVLQESFVSHGYQVDVAATGHEAGAKFRSKAYDVVVVDQHVPDLPGEQLLENLKQHSTGAVFLAITEDSRPGLELDWMQRGAAAIVRKPFTAQHLVEVCARALRERDWLGIEHRLETQTRELRQREADLVQAQEVARLGTWFFDVKTGSAWWSTEMYRIFGLAVNGGPPSWHHGMGGLFHPDDWKWIFPLLKDALADGLPYDFYARFYKLDGSVGWAHAVGKPCRGAAGKVEKITNTLQDVTELKQGEAELQASRERLQGIVAATPSCIKLVAPDGTLLEMNEHGLKMVEADCASSVVGASVYSLIAPGHREAFVCFNRHICAGGSGSLEFEVVGLRGTRRWMQTHAVPLRDPACERTLHLAITLDVTERKQAEEALLQSKLRLELAHQAAGAGTWDWDVISERLDWSPELFSMFGLDPGKSEATFATWRRLLHPDDLEIASQRIEQAIKEETPLNSEYRVIHPGGQVRWINALGNTIYGSTGQPLRMIGLCMDITERKQADEVLKQSEQNYREIFDSVTDAVFIHDARTGVIVDVNDTMLKIYGYSDKKEVINLHPNNIGYGHSPYGYQEAAEWMRRAIEEGPQLFEWCAHTKAGRPLWVEVALRSATINGQPRVLAVVRDATERKQVEETLRRYEMALEQSSDGIAMTDLDGRLIFVNQSWSHMHGCTSEELIGQPASMGHTPEQLELDVEPFNRMVIERGQHHGEVGHLRRDGTTFPTWMSGTLLKNDKGIPIGILGITRDITERKQAEAEKEKLHEQLAQAQKMESVGRLAGGVAHDFNNMLGAILGNVNLALREAPPGSLLRESLEEIEKCANRSADLTRQLLAFARKQTIMPQVLDLNATVDGMLKMLRRLIGEDIDLAWLPAADLWAIKVDPSQIDQILANLCVNARDAIGGVGKVTLGTANVSSGEVDTPEHLRGNPRDYVRLSVTDNGCGMTQETLSHLFEPFFTTKGIGLGTGLGLATVYGIVQQNEGFINVHSELTRGTTFMIYLPRHLAKAPIVPNTGDEAPLSRGSETILLVEDEPSLLRVGRRALEGLGYRVLAASSPGEAIHLAEAHSGQIDLLVTDVVMPEMDGRDLAKRLVSLYPSLKRLFMSGYTADVIAHHGVLEAGIPFLQKPFSVEALADKVRATITGSQ